MSGDRITIGRRAVLSGLGTSALLIPAGTRAASAYPPALAITEGQLVQGGWARGQAAPDMTLTLDGSRWARTRPGVSSSLSTVMPARWQH